MPDNNFVYEDAINELETIVNKLNSGSVTLDESLTLYTRGVELAAQCENKINEIEQKISIVNKATMTEEPFTIPEED